MKFSLVGALLLLSAAAAQAEIYTWQNAQGTVFYTNSIHEIPARYLNKARVLDVATGKKGGLATAQPATPPASAGGGQTAPAAPPAGQAAAGQTVTMPAPTSPGPAATAPSFSKQALERPRRAPRPPRRPSSEEEQ